MRIPTGCDQQGRYPQAAEACTELGQDDFDDAAALIFKSLLTAVAIVAIIALAVALR